MKNITEIEIYLQNKINNWYKEVSRDYGVNGHFNSVIVADNDLIIAWTENNELQTMKIAYFEDYTKEQIYNIWMEG